MIVQKLKLFALVFAVGAAGLFVFLSFREQPLVTSQQFNNATIQHIGLRIDFGDGNVQNFSDISYVTGATAFSILKDVVTKEKIPFVYDPSTGAGVFIRKIGEKKNGDGGRYWQYWVNETFAMVAADKYALHAGDTVEWKFKSEIQ